MNRLMRLGLQILAALLTLTALICLLVLIGIGTEAGSRSSFNLIVGLVTNDTLKVSGQVRSGTWLEGMAFEELLVSQTGAQGSGLELEIDEVHFVWQPWRLLDRQLLLDEVELTGVRGSYRGGNQAPSAPLTETALQGMLFELPLSVTLGLARFSDIEFQVDGTVVATDSLEFAAELNSQSLAVSKLQWQQDASGISARLSLSRALALDGQVQWQTQIADLRYQGEVTLGGSLNSLTLDHVLDAPLQLRSTGFLVPGLFAGETLNFSLQHRGDALDMSVFGVDGLVLAAVDLQTGGAVEQISINGTLSLRYPDIPDTAVQLALQWRDGQVFADTLILDNPEGQLAVTGMLQPGPLSLQADWQIPRLSPGDRFPQFRLSEISGSGSVSVMQGNEAMETRVRIASLRGSLNERPLNVAGDLSLSGAVLNDVQLQAQSGANTLDLQGGAGNELDLEWSVQAPELMQIWEGIAGSIQGQGRISGTQDEPRVDGDIQVENLRLTLDDSVIGLDSARVQAQYQRQQNSILLTLQNLTSTGGSGVTTLLESAELSAQGDLEQHQVSAQVVNPEATVDLSLSGGLAEQVWQGQLLQTQVESDYGNWQQLDPISIRAGAQVVEVPDLCLTMTDTRVCANISGNPATGIDLQASVNSLPLAWANRDALDKPPALQTWQDALALNLPAGLAVEGSADLDLQVEQFRAGQWDLLTVSIAPSDLVLQLTTQQEDDLQTLAPLIQRFGFNATTINVDNRDNAWHSAVGFTVAEVSDTLPGLQGTFSSDVSLLEGGALDGTLNFNFSDLAWLESVVPGIRDSAGVLVGQASLGGNQEHPMITAKVELEQASFLLPAYGLDLQGVTATLTSTQDNTITLQASAGSGSGMLSLDARVLTPLLPEREITARAQGESFTVMQTAAATVNISPDLSLHYLDNTLEVSGKTGISNSHVDLAEWVGELSSSAISESRDTVIVRQPDGLSQESKQGQALGLVLDVALTLDEAVTLSGYGLDVSLGGSLELEQEAGRPLLAYGELNIPSGTYEAYNQSLTTRNGRLLFFGNPANPVLDIRAFRETSSAEVGLILSGPVNKIQGELYSTPALPENEVLALLVTGKSFNNVGAQDSDALLSTIANFGIEKGQGLTGAVSDKLGLDSVSVNGGSTYKESTLGLGKYITPNLLMHYEVGLFDRQFVLSIDYTLTEHLKLEVESGISQSVDISYTLEQD